MKIYSLRASFALFISSATVLSLALLMLVSFVMETSTIGALGGLPNHGFVMLQDSNSALAIIGLAIGAGIAMGLSGVGASLGMATTSAAALGAITERPELFGKSILFVVFIEAVAIYGFVIAFMLVGYIPSLAG